MSEDQLASRLEDLEETARLLNEVTERANAKLKAVEEQLWKLNIGLEVWLDEAEYDALDSEEDNDPGVYVKVERWTVLGFTKIGEMWRIATRVYRFDTTLDANKNPSMFGEYDTDPIPIRNASRKHRIRALELLPKLLEKLQTEAQRTIQAVNQLVSR